MSRRGVAEFAGYGDDVARARWILALLATTLATAVAPAAGIGLFTPDPAEAASSPTPAHLRPELVGNAGQLVVVSSSSWTTTFASVTLYEHRANGWVAVNRLPFSARVGRHGTSLSHLEGDGTSPAGSFPLLSAFGAATVGHTRLAYTKVHDGSCWISDASRADYNTMVDQKPCSGANEDLNRIARGGPYARAIVTGYNIGPIVPGKGSAIFIHLHSRTANGATRATSGCVSLSPGSMATLWSWVDPAKHPRVVIGPSTWLTGA